MTDKPVTRSELRTALVVNAATDPTALVAAAVIAVVAILTGLVWLIPVFAVPGYLALAGTTFFSEEAAKKVYGGSQEKDTRTKMHARGFPYIVRKKDDEKGDEI